MKAERATAAPDRFDAIVIGAGISGMYQLYRLRELGLSARVFEAGSGVGGTWYWNRYPGARFDSESYSYGYSFSRELLEEWEWSEHFAAQPETLRYLEFVADKFDLRRDIEFNARVTRATWIESDRCWEVETEGGRVARGRFLITAIGILSTPAMPRFEGQDRFKGRLLHTALWPHDPVDFAGKRVGVIGTGATGVQVIQEVAKTAAHLTVFQRTPNYCAPLRNRPIDRETQRRIKGDYPAIFQKCRETYGGFLHGPDPRSLFQVTAAEREALWEKLYSEPGFGLWLANFIDVIMDPKANALATAFVQQKIRARVRDPRVAEQLIPKDHGFGTRRVPLETGYYEVYNQANVELVDVMAAPIQRLTARGLATSEHEYDLDIIICATGFDAVTGSFGRIDIRGENGQRLKDKWSDGPRTLLGMQVEGFPNFLMLVGPHNAATFCNIPRCIEQNVDWVTGLLRHLRERNLTRLVAKPEAEEAWTKHVYEVADLVLLSKTRSWFTGSNPNLPGKPRTFYAYAGGVPVYRQRCDEVAAGGYREFNLS